MNDMPITKRRWQFSLRSLLLMTAAVSTGLAWWASRDRIPKDWELAKIYEAATNKISGEEERYSNTDLPVFKANVDGAMEVVSLRDFMGADGRLDESAFLAAAHRSSYVLITR